MKSFGKTAKEYSYSTSIHGISYIFENDVFIFERSIWVLAVFSGIILATIMSVTAFLDWRNKPVLTTVATTGYPIENIEFPAITICAQVWYISIIDYIWGWWSKIDINFKLKGMSREIIDSAIVQQFKKYLKTKNKVLEELQETELKEE